MLPKLSLITYSEDTELNSSLVEELVERLDGNVIIPLSHPEKSMLATVAHATIEVWFKLH